MKNPYRILYYDTNGLYYFDEGEFPSASEALKVAMESNIQFKIIKLIEFIENVTT